MTLMDKEITDTFRMSNEAKQMVSKKADSHLMLFI